MKLLYYNWVQFDDPEGRSGGVRLYQSNLIRHLAETTDHEIYVVSSGLEHDKLDASMRFEPTENALGNRVSSFAFVNSPVLAPGHHAFGSEHLFDEGAALEQWHAFLRQHGPFDVVQFDALEGVPFTWLRIHEVHPQTRVMLYSHNYYLVCPQVNLWKRETQHCVDYRQGKDCATCLVVSHNPNEVLRAHQLSRLLRTAGITPGSASYKAAYAVYAKLKTGSVSRAMFRAGVRAILESAAFVRRAGYALRGKRRPDEAIDSAVPLPSPVVDAPPAGAVLSSQARFSEAGKSGTTESKGPVSLTLTPGFRERRERGTDLINREVDVVLATSERTSQVITERGVDAGRVEVVYIGSKAAENLDVDLRRMHPRVPGKLTIAYLGYMRRDKGFAALLSALRLAPSDLQASLRLVIAAKMEPKFEDSLMAAAQQLDDVLHYDGYTHERLPQILETVDVGIVPVQWEDNLPQVAIEMMAHGLPLLTSDRGGAQELGGRNPDFIFKADSPSSLHARLRALLSGSTPLSSFWSSAIELTTMPIHVKRLMELYTESNSPLHDAGGLPTHGDRR